MVALSTVYLVIVFMLFEDNNNHAMFVGVKKTNDTQGLFIETIGEIVCIVVKWFQ